jgi:hypothetical protein
MANVKAVKGGIPALQEIMDEALGMGKHCKKAKSRRAPRRVAWPTGRTILRVRFMNAKELEREGWDGAGGAIALDLNDGGILYASCDDEGNNAGVFFAMSPRGEALRVHPIK